MDDLARAAVAARRAIDLRQSNAHDLTWQRDDIAIALGIAPDEDAISAAMVNEHKRREHMNTTEKITLDDCECEETGIDGGQRYTHESGAYVEIIHDECPHHPLDDVEGIALAFREGDHYNGTADDYPRYSEIDCPTCEGSGQSLDRFELLKLAPYAHVVIGAGTEGAMLALAEMYAEDRTCVDPAECQRCRATGQVDADLETYFRVERGARAIYQFRTGNHGEASAVMYVTDDDWTDPAGAAVAWADEYQKWAEGDVWGIEYGGPGIETESCWGFIGRENAEEAALNEFLLPAIEDVEREHREAAYWADRGIETVG